jgi:exonuclease III
MNPGSLYDPLSSWRDDDDSSTNNDDEEMNRWNALDGDYIGDILKEEKEENTTRVYFQNLNGLKWDKHGGIWPMICQSMAAIHADIACFSEVNQDTSKFEIRDKMQTVAGQQFDHVRMVTATSNRKAKRHYKPGGTTMLTMMETVALSKDPTRDRMGRWVSTRYSRGNGANVTVIGAYQVCQTHRTGRVTAATQQINQLLEEYATTNTIGSLNPREAFIRDLGAFIQQRQQCGDMIVLGGDFNEAMSSTAGLFTIASQCGLVDIFSKKLGTSDGPATFKGGSKRLDYILLSPDLEHMVKASGYEPYDYRGVFSDHRPMFVDFDSTALFGTKPVPLASSTQRDFKASDPSSVRAYVETKFSELLKHNFLERIQTLESLRSPNHDIAERLDRDMQRAAIIATKAG